MDGTSCLGAVQRPATAPAVKRRESHGCRSGVTRHRPGENNAMRRAAGEAIEERRLELRGDVIAHFERVDLRGKGHELP